MSNVSVGDSLDWATDDFSDDEWDVTDAGKSFGEIALLSEDSVRNASIIADELSDLLVIDRGLFNGTLKAKQEAEYRERKQFIRKSPLFRSWTPRFRRLCEMSLRKEVHPFDGILVRQGDPVVGLHFIIRGQGKLTVNPELHKQQYPKLYERANSAMARGLGRRRSEKVETKVKDNMLTEHIRVRRREGYAAAERRLARKAITLCYADENEVIGDIELVFGLDTYSQTVVCTANTEVLILDNKNIERLIHKKNPSTMEMLKSKAEGKVRSRMRMKTDIQIDLYRHLAQKLDEVRPKRTQSALAMAAADDEEDDNRRSLHDILQDKDYMVSQLSRMFLQDRTPFIEPCVPGALYFRAKSAARANRRAFTEQTSPGGKPRPLSTTGEVRLQRARRSAQRQPRSRRELERLTIGRKADDVRQLQSSNHVVSRYLATGGQRPASSKPDLTSSAYGTLHEGPFGSSGTPGGADSLIFRLTEVKEADPEFRTGPGGFHRGDEGQLVLDQDAASKHHAVREVVMAMNIRQQERNASRSRIVCSMMEHHQAAAGPGSGSGSGSGSGRHLMRPKSAPVPSTPGRGSRSRSHHRSHPRGGDNLEGEDRDGSPDDNFDWETSDPSLRQIEDKLRLFHEAHDQDGGKKSHSSIHDLRRFSIQKSCQFPSGTASSNSHHQHIQRFMVPKDAYRLALKVKAIQDEKSRDSSEDPDVRRGRTANRVQSAAVGTIQDGGGNHGHGRNGEQMSLAMRIQSAPTKRSLSSNIQH